MVQVQKVEVREALLKAAKQEFLGHGFQLSSLRRIAKEAGTTIGNVYKYFQSKDDLFEQLVSEANIQLYYFMKEHDKGGSVLPKEEYEQLQLFASLMGEYRDEILLLVDASDGTKYENTYEEMIDVISNNLRQHLSDFNIPVQLEDSASDVLTRTLAVGLLCGILDILRLHTDKNEIKNGVKLYFSFIFRSFK